MQRSFITLPVISAVLLSVTSLACAQSASTLLALPWQGGGDVDLISSNWSQAEGEADQSGMDVRLSRYQAAGRWLLDPGDPLSPSAALSWHQLDIHSSDTALPDRLVDVSAAGSVLFDMEQDRSLRVTVGGGYAGDNAFGDGRAYYGLADLVYTEPIDKQSGYMFILSYNGNRTFLPDVPLPGFVYYDALDENTFYTLGIPASSVTHKLDDRTTVRARYILPININASIEYELDDAVTLFGRFDSDTNAYTLDSDPDNRRLMFSQQRIEGGAVWVHEPSGVELTVAGGYAFDQEFTRGWDSRDDDTVRDISDEPYLRIGLKISF